jgi:p-aminobenzoyl-glutamate transporter AbgT
MMANQYFAYSIMALLQIVAAFLVYKMVAEPDIMNAREEKRMGKKSCMGKIWSLLK